MRLITVAYHHITKEESSLHSRLYMSAAKFEEHVRYLINLRVPVISTMHEVKSIQNKEEKAVMLTFDDAFEDFYQYAFPVLKKFGTPAVLFVPTAKVGLYTYEPDYGSHQAYVTLRQIQEMQQSGLVSIQPHGHSHVRLKELSIQAQYSEIKLSISYLKTKLGTTSEFFCLPYGSFDETTITLLKSAGVQFVFTTRDSHNLLSATDHSRPLLINRYAFKSRMGLEDFVSVIESPETVLYPIDASDQQSQD